MIIRGEYRFNPEFVVCHARQTNMTAGQLAKLFSPPLTERDAQLLLTFKADMTEDGHIVERRK